MRVESVAEALFPEHNVDILGARNVLVLMIRLQPRGVLLVPSGGGVAIETSVEIVRPRCWVQNVQGGLVVESPEVYQHLDVQFAERRVRFAVSVHRMAIVPERCLVGHAACEVQA